MLVVEVGAILIVPILVVGLGVRIISLRAISVIRIRIKSKNIISWSKINSGWGLGAILVAWKEKE